MVSNPCLPSSLPALKKRSPVFLRTSWRFPRGFSSVVPSNGRSSYLNATLRIFLRLLLPPVPILPSSLLYFTHSAALNSILHFLFLFCYALPRLRSSLSLIVLPPTTTTHPHPPRFTSLETWARPHYYFIRFLLETTDFLSVVLPFFFIGCFPFGLFLSLFSL